MLEVAFTLPVFLLLLMAILEFSLIFHLMSLTNFATTEAARLGKTGALYGAASREELIAETITNTLEPWMRSGTSLEIESESAGSFDDIGNNGTPVGGQGGELVLYTVTFNWPVITPLFRSFFENGMVPIYASVLVKNEDF